jgi:hypothetical protein
MIDVLNAIAKNKVEDHDETHALPRVMFVTRQLGENIEPPVPLGIRPW